MKTEDVGWVAEDGAAREVNWQRGAMIGLGVGILLDLVWWQSSTHGYSSRHAQNIAHLTVFMVVKFLVQCIFTGGLIGGLGALRDYTKSIAVGCVVGLLFSLNSLDLMQSVWEIIWGGGLGGLCCYYARNEPKAIWGQRW